MRFWSCDHSPISMVIVVVFSAEKSSLGEVNSKGNIKKFKEKTNDPNEIGQKK